MASGDMEVSESGESPAIQPEELSPTPPPRDGRVQIPPTGSGERLGFYLGAPSSSNAKAAKGGCRRVGLPPVAASGSSRKRASSSDGGGPAQKKGTTMNAGDKWAQMAKSPMGTSCSSEAPSESVNEISDDEDEVVEVNVAGAARGGEGAAPSMPAPAIMSFFHDIVAQQRPAAARVQGEIEHYLADDLVPYTEKFDVLDWWKVAGTRYPTLRKLARDVFAIPVTTVASESAFSMSGRIVTDHRSRLTSKMLEVLMCYQNWLRNKYKDAHLGEGSFWTCLQDTRRE